MLSLFVFVGVYLEGRRDSPGKSIRFTQVRNTVGFWSRTNVSGCDRHNIDHLVCVEVWQNALTRSEIHDLSGRKVNRV